MAVRGSRYVESRRTGLLKSCLLQLETLAEGLAAVLVLEAPIVHPAMRRFRSVLDVAGDVDYVIRTGNHCCCGQFSTS